MIRTLKRRPWNERQKGVSMRLQYLPCLAVLYGAVLYCTVLYCMYCTVLYSTVLYCAQRGWDTEKEAMEREAEGGGEPRDFQ